MFWLRNERKNNYAHLYGCLIIQYRGTARAWGTEGNWPKLEGNMKKLIWGEQGNNPIYSRGTREQVSHLGAPKYNIHKTGGKDYPHYLLFPHCMRIHTFSMELKLNMRVGPDSNCKTTFNSYKKINAFTFSQISSFNFLFKKAPHQKTNGLSLI